MKTTLVLGYGLLGKELVAQSKWDYISKSKDKDFNFTDPQSYENIISKYTTIINCVGCTRTYSKDREKHWKVNYKGVADLVDICKSKCFNFQVISILYRKDIFLKSLFKK